MFRRSTWTLMGMQFGEMKGTNPSKKWSDLFWKPDTKDERVKAHVPEVLEESLAEQRAVLAHQTTRDSIVEHGHKVLREIENKAPAPSIFPAINNILRLYGNDHLISQRGLNLLVYPGTAACYQQTQPPELVSAFGDNFKTFIDSIEQNGSFVHDVKLPAIAEATERLKLEKAEKAKVAAIAASEPTAAVEGAEPADAPAAADGAEGATSTDATAANAAAEEASEDTVVFDMPDAEPADVTYFVKCISGMAMANVQIGDASSALRCCDVALEHVIDDTRKGGVLALKAGVQIKLKDYAGAHESALAAIAVSQNPQGFIQGAAALRLLKRDEEAIALLTEGVEANPGNEGLATYLAANVEAQEKRAVQIEAAKQAGEELIESGSRTRRRRLQIA
jgi:hypothetical protein